MKISCNVHCKTCCKLRIRMSLEMHYLHFHLDFFRSNLSDVNEVNVERFHQGIPVMEKRYQGRWDGAMIGDFITTPLRDDKQISKRNCRLSAHF